MKSNQNNFFLQMRRGENKLAVALAPILGDWVPIVWNNSVKD